MKRPHHSNHKSHSGIHESQKPQTHPRLTSSSEWDDELSLRIVYIGATHCYDMIGRKSPGTAGGGLVCHCWLDGTQAFDMS